MSHSAFEINILIERTFFGVTSNTFLMEGLRGFYEMTSNKDFDLFFYHQFCTCRKWGTVRKLGCLGRQIKYCIVLCDRGILTAKNSKEHNSTHCIKCDRLNCSVCWNGSLDPNLKAAAHVVESWDGHVVHPALLKNPTLHQFPVWCDGGECWRKAESKNKLPYFKNFPGQDRSVEFSFFGDYLYEFKDLRISI